MDLSPPAFWWVIAGAVVAAELATGTFYLLMLALGMAAAAVAAHLQLPLNGQIITAALVGGGSTAIWHWHRMRQPRSAPANENRDVNLDIGEQVNVTHWSPNRSAQVIYRGSPWTAHLKPGASASPGWHVIVAVESNWLILAPMPAPPTSR